MIFTVVSKQKVERKNKINKILNDSIGEINDFNFSKIDFSNTDINDFINECLSLPFCSNKKAILVEYTGDLFADSKYKFKDDKESDFVNLLNNNDESIDIIFSLNSDEIDIKNSKLAQILKEKSNFEEVKISKSMVQLIMDFVSQKGHKIEKNAAEELAARVGDNTQLMINEVEKICLYTDEIKFSDIDKLTPRPLEENAFLISNALLKKNNLYALEIYNDLKIKNVEPVSLISLLSNQFNLIYSAKYLSEVKNQSYSEIAKELNITDIRAKILVRNGSSIDFDNLRNIFVSLSDLDTKIKTSQVDRFYAFEMFLINFNLN